MSADSESLALFSALFRRFTRVPLIPCNQVELSAPQVNIRQCHHWQHTFERRCSEFQLQAIELKLAWLVEKPAQAGTPNIVSLRGLVCFLFQSSGWLLRFRDCAIPKSHNDGLLSALTAATNPLILSFLRLRLAARHLFLTLESKYFQEIKLTAGLAISSAAQLLKIDEPE